MFKGLLKKYIFVLCSSISSTACLAMELDEGNFSKSIYKQKIEQSFDYGSKNAFNSILLYMEESTNAPLFLARMFKYWPDKIKFFEDQLEENLKSLTHNKAQRQYLIDVEKKYLESLCLLPKSDKNINSHLDLPTLNNLGYRSLNFGAKSEDKAQMIKFIDLSIWYSIMGAKTGCEYSYLRLKNTIEFEIDNKKRYTTYYTFLIPLLMQEDEQAQMLFTKVCMDSEGALNWVKDSQIKVFKEAMVKFNQAQHKKYYDAAMQLWKKSPAEAIELLLKAEDRCTEADEKLSELRKSNNYLKPKKGKAHIHSRLLKEADTKKSAEYYRAYCIMFKNASYKPRDLSKMCVFLQSAIELGNPDAIKEHKRIEISKGYTDAVPDKTLSSTNFEYTFAQNYKAFQFLGEGLVSTKPLVQDKISQQYTPYLSEGTQKPNNTNAVNNNNSPLIEKRSIINLLKEKKDSIEQDPRITLIRKCNESMKESPFFLEPTNTQEKAKPNSTNVVKALSLDTAINTINPYAVEELKRLDKPEYPTDVAFLREYKELENSRNLVTSTPVLSTAKTNNNSPQPMTSPKEDSSSQSKPSFEGVVLQKIDIQADALSFPEKTKNVEIKEKENKTELPLSSSITNDQAPNQSLEEGQDSVNVSLKPRRTLQRTQSLVTLPSSAEKEKNIPFAKPKRTLNRTLSLNGSDFPVHNAKESKKASSDENKNSPNENMKTKHPSKKFSFKTHKLFKKKEKAEKNQETMKQSSSSTKTSSSKSVSEEQFSKSEDSLSTSKEKVAFSKFIRALEGAQTKKDVKLSAGTITSTLKQLNNVTYKKNGNTISATHNLNSEIHLTLHTHDDSGTLWYKKPENVEHFLWFVGECNLDLKDQIYKIGKK